MILGAVVRGWRLGWAGFYWEILSLAAILDKPAPTILRIVPPIYVGCRMISVGHHD